MSRSKTDRWWCVRRAGPAGASHGERRGRAVALARSASSSRPTRRRRAPLRPRSGGEGCWPGRTEAVAPKARSAAGLRHVSARGDYRFASPGFLLPCRPTRSFRFWAARRGFPLDLTSNWFLRPPPPTWALIPLRRCEYVIAL